MNPPRHPGLWLATLLITILLSALLASCKSVTSGVDPSALKEADRYLTLLKAKAAGTKPGSIVSISEIKAVKVTPTGYQFTLDVTHYNGMVIQYTMEINRNPDGSYSVEKMRNY